MPVIAYSQDPATDRNSELKDASHSIFTRSATDRNSELKDASHSIFTRFRHW